MKKIRDNKGRAGRIMPLAVAVVVFILSFWGCVGAISVRAEEREEESDIEDVAEQNSVTQRQAGGTHVLTYYDTRYNDGLLRVGYFEIDGGTTAMCVCHEMEPPTQTGSTLTTVAEYTAENRGNEQLRKIYYYGWKGPGDVGASYVETCLAGSVANGHDDNYYGYGQAFINRFADFRQRRKDLRYICCQTERRHIRTWDIGNITRQGMQDLKRQRRITN